MNFNVLLQDKVNEVDDIVKSFLPEEKGYQQTVLKAMNYSVLAGGKRQLNVNIETYLYNKLKDEAKRRNKTLRELVIEKLSR